MYPSIDVQFDNYKAFNKQLDSLESDIRTKARYSGIVEMAKPLKKVIKSNLARHVVSGALYKSIGHRKITNTQKSTLGMQAGDDGLVVGAMGKVFHASLVKKRSQQYKMHFLEEGTAAHKIKAKKGSVLTFGGRNVKSVNHPGTRGLFILQRSNRHMQSQYTKYFAIGAQRALKRHGVTL